MKDFDSETSFFSVGDDDSPPDDFDGGLMDFAGDSFDDFAVDGGLRLFFVGDFLAGGGGGCF